MIDIDKLEAGPALNALVADKVMGKPDDVPACAPEYSTDMSAAWQIVEKLATLHFRSLEFENYTHQQRIKLWSPMREVIAHGETAPLAICRAALKAVGA